LGGEQWQAFALPEGLTGRIHAAAVAEPGQDAIRVWTGLTEPATSAHLLGLEQPPAGSPGGLRLDLKTGAWTQLTASQLAPLPGVQAEPAVVSAGLGQAYLVGATTSSKAELWLVDLSAEKKQLLWQGGATGPNCAGRCSLIYDAPAKRLVLVSPGAGLQVWTAPLADPANWTLVLSGSALTGARAVILGAPDAVDRLLVVSHGPGGGASEGHRLLLGAVPTWQPAKGAPWNGPLTQGWQVMAGRAILEGGVTPAGAAVGGIWQVSQACVK